MTGDRFLQQNHEHAADTFPVLKGPGWGFDRQFHMSLYGRGLNVWRAAWRFGNLQMDICYCQRGIASEYLLVKATAACHGLVAQRCLVAVQGTNEDAIFAMRMVGQRLLLLFITDMFISVVKSTAQCRTLPGLGM